MANAQPAVPHPKDRQTHHRCRRDVSGQLQDKVDNHNHMKRTLPFDRQNQLLERELGQLCFLNDDGVLKGRLEFAKCAVHFPQLVKGVVAQEPG